MCALGVTLGARGELSNYLQGNVALIHRTFGYIHVKMYRCNIIKILFKHFPHRPRLDVPCWTCPPAAAARTRPTAQNDQSHGNRLSRRDPRWGQYWASVAGNVEIQSDLPAFSRGESLKPNQGAKKFCQSWVKAFQYMAVNEDIFSIKKVLYTHLRIILYLDGELMPCRAKMHSVLLPAFCWGLWGLFLLRGEESATKEGG